MSKKLTLGVHRHEFSSCFIMQFKIGTFSLKFNINQFYTKLPSQILTMTDWKWLIVIDRSNFTETNLLKPNMFLLWLIWFGTIYHIDHILNPNNHSTTHLIQFS